MRPSCLFLAHRIPYPPDKGEKIRAWNVFAHLARRHRMHLGCFIDDPADRAHVPMLRAACADLLCLDLDPRRQKLRALGGLRPGRPLTRDYFRDARMQHWVEATLAHGIDRVFVFSSGMAGYVMDIDRPGMVLDMVDVDSEKFTEYARRAAWPARLVWAREGRTLLRFERQAAAHFARTLFVSHDEADRFATLAPEVAGRIDWVENGVDLDRFAPGLDLPSPFPDAAPRIVFTGTMDYWPNADGVAWFVQAVMPLLRARTPAPQFCIVGANPAPEVLRLAGPRVQVTGRVADVRPYVAHAGVVVAPLRIARGIQNKVLEAMAMARPVVATPQAFEGVHAEPGRDLLVGADAAAMAALVDQVLDGAYPALGTAARQAMQRGHAWSATLRRLDELPEFQCRDQADAAPQGG